MDNVEVKWRSIISVVNTRCIRPFCRHVVYYSQPITAHGLPLVRQQKTNKFVNGQHCMLNVGQLFEHTTDFCLPTLLANTCWPMFVGRVSVALQGGHCFGENKIKDFQAPSVQLSISVNYYFPLFCLTGQFFPGIT